MSLPVPSAGGVRTQISADPQQRPVPRPGQRPCRPRCHLEQGLLSFPGAASAPGGGEPGALPRSLPTRWTHLLHLFPRSATCKVPMVPGPALWLQLLSILVGMWMSKATFCLILDCPHLPACCPPPPGLLDLCKQTSGLGKGLPGKMASLWQPGALSLRSP